MNVISPNWSLKHKELGTIIRNPAYFLESLELTKELHSELHMGKVSVSNEKNEIDNLLFDIETSQYWVMPTKNDETMAWSLWHIARIEDLTMNILVGNTSQIFDEVWQKRMNVQITDTGNAMTDEEIIDFSKQICLEELLNYRNEVGMQTRKVIDSLQPDDLKRKINQEAIAKIREEGGVTEHQDSIWLLDFWSKKDVAGIIMMPITRHQTLHLNDCFKWKEHIKLNKKCFIR